MTHRWPWRLRPAMRQGASLAPTLSEIVIELGAANLLVGVAAGDGAGRPDRGAPFAGKPAPTVLWS
ncbi:hypothetical protein ACW9JA_21845, partial [Pseudomonas gingeri]